MKFGIGGQNPLHFSYEDSFEERKYLYLSRSRVRVTYNASFKQMFI